jgi:transposase-like protein
MDNQLTILKRDARGRVRSTVEARAEAVAEYRRSGLSASAFATMAGISKNTFWNWLHNHRLTQKRALSKSKSHPPVRFVHVVAQAAPASALLVRLPGGATVEVTTLQERSIARRDCSRRSLSRNTAILCRSIGRSRSTPPGTTSPSHAKAWRAGSGWPPIG